MIRLDFERRRCEGEDSVGRREEMEEEEEEGDGDGEGEEKEDEEEVGDEAGGVGSSTRHVLAWAYGLSSQCERRGRGG